MTMKLRAQALAFILTSTLTTHAALAQTAQGDFIVAVVNSEPITELELRAEVQRFTQQMAQQRQPALPAAEMRRGVLERMINERAQLQTAREMGMRVDEADVDRTEQAIARQNQIDVVELRKRVAKDGMTVSQLRSRVPHPHH